MESSLVWHKRFALSFVAFLSICSVLVVNSRAEEPTLKVGFVLSMTGVWSEYGIAQKNGLELARQDYPENFKNIQFIFEDCGHQGTMTLSAYNKLTNWDHINLLYAWGVQPVEILAPLAESARLPMLASAQVASAAKGRHFVIRSLNYSEQNSKKLLEFLRMEGDKKLGLVQVQMSYYDLLRAGMEKHLKPSESLELIEHVGPEATDFRTIVLKAKQQNYDRIGLFLTPPQMLEFVREAAQLKFKYRIFGMHPLQSTTLKKQAGGLLDGAVYVHNMVSDEFRAKYTSAYGNDQQIPWAANAYDMGVLIGDLFGGEKKTPDADEIMNKFRAVKERDGVGGHFVFRDTPETGMFYDYPLAVYKVSSGQDEIVMK